MRNIIEDDFMNFIDDYITLNEGKYIVHREFNDIDYNFGEFNSLSKAVEFRDNIDSDGWPLKKDTPIFTLDGKKPLKYYIKQFINNKIIILNRNVTEEDPNINQIYKKFKIYVKEENIHISLKTFKYFFPRLIDKKSIKRKQLNGFTKYNITFKENEKNNLNKKNFNNEKIKNTKDIEIITTELHGRTQIVPRLNEFFKEKIVVINRETTENDPILDDVLKEFNQFLKKYNEKVKLNSLSNYFGKIFLTKKHSMKLVINGKTHYNISFNKKQDITPNDYLQNSLKNKGDNSKKIQINYEITINEINNISLITIEGKSKFIHFDYIMDILKKIKNNIISLNIDIKNDLIFFNIELIEHHNKKSSIIDNINNLFN